jgi:hypothetical protein
MSRGGKKKLLLFFHVSDQLSEYLFPGGTDSPVKGLPNPFLQIVLWAPPSPFSAFSTLRQIHSHHSDGPAMSPV